MIEPSPCKKPDHDGQRHVQPNRPIGADALESLHESLALMGASGVPRPSR
jgi:hypothetical protein